MREREATLLGAATAFVFAAQMLNFPLGTGTSAHLLGSVLVAVVLGPWSAMLVMFSVLLVQALLFQDGGIAALGANTLNVAVIGVLFGYGIYRWCMALFGAGLRVRIVAAAVAAFLSTVLVGLAVAVELALSGTVPLATAALLLGGAYVLVGVGEAVLTGVILGILFRMQPALLESQAAPSRLERRLAFVATAAAGVIALIASYFASSRPDALEAASSSMGIDALMRTYFTGPFVEYSAPFGGPWVVGTVGVLAVFLVVWALVRVALKVGRS